MAFTGGLQDPQLHLQAHYRRITGAKWHLQAQNGIYRRITGALQARYRRDETVTGAKYHATVNAILRL